VNVKETVRFKGSRGKYRLMQAVLTERGGLEAPASWWCSGAGRTVLPCSAAPGLGLGLAGGAQDVLGKGF